MTDFPHESSFNYQCFQASEKIQTKIEEVIETAPRNSEWVAFTDLYQYEGFWHSPRFLQGSLIAQQQFQPQSNDIILCSSPKTGTTWLKALAFATLKRDILDDPNNPLLSTTPHEIVPYLEVDLFQPQKSLHYPKIPLLATHLPYNSLPQPIIASNCKLIYICRDPKDVFVSMWHFMGNVRSNGTGHFPLEKAFELFCKGVSLNGPYWDHVLGFWNASLEYPEKILFVKYEELKSDTKSYVRRIAEFIGYPILSEEEKEGVVEKIVQLCSFKNLSNLEVNKKGKYPIFESVLVENKKYFRKGEVGDWKNCLTNEMKERLDRITADKLRSTGLTFD